MTKVSDLDAFWDSVCFGLLRQLSALSWSRKDIL